MPTTLDTLQYTVEDYLALPESGPRYELIEGELHMTPAPATRHQRISRNLEYLLHSYAIAHENGEVFYAPFDVFLGEYDVVQPDIVWVSRKRAELVSARGLEGAPDLVVEILSPATALLDLHTKRKLYQRTGVRELWIVDPTDDSITVHHLATGKDSERFEEDAVVESTILPDFRPALSRIFPRREAREAGE